MALTIERLDDLMRECRESAETKIRAAANGNDHVSDGRFLTNAQLLELCAIAKIGLPFWYRPGSGLESPLLTTMREFARQKLICEMDGHTYKVADIEGAYETMVEKARRIMVKFP